MKQDWFMWLFYCFNDISFSFIKKNFHAETNTVSSTVVNNTPPTANAPVLPNSNSDICKVGVGGAVQNNVLGIATGVLIDDELCQLLKLSRSQYAFGMKVSAVAILMSGPSCLDKHDGCRDPVPCKRVSSGLKLLHIGKQIQIKFQTAVDTNQNILPQINQNQRSLVMHKMLLCLKLCLLLLLVSSYSKADCLPDVQGLCTPGVTITED